MKPVLSVILPTGDLLIMGDITIKTLLENR